MGYLAVRNWNRHQHYKDRNPPWIKFYVELLDDLEIRGMPVATQLFWDRILLLAARYNNRIPDDPQALATLTGIESKAVRQALLTLTAKKMLTRTQTLRKRNSGAGSGASNPASVGASNPASTRARPPARERQRESKNTPPTPPAGGNGRRPITIKELRRYTGCRATRGSHGSGYKRDPLGTDRPPVDWPHDKPTREQVEAALAALHSTYPDEPPVD